jgi:hypothetical protein
MKVNLDKVTGNGAPAAAAPKNEIIIFEADNVVFPTLGPGGVKLEGSFVLPSGEKMIKIYSTKSKTEATMETDGDEDNQSFKSMFKAQHPGNSQAVKEFIRLWTGKNIIVMHKACGEAHYEVMGTPCAPLQLKSAKKDDNDGRFYTLSFEPFAKSAFVPMIYDGTVIIAEPTAYAGTISIAQGNQYNVPTSTTGDPLAIDLIDNTNDTIITFIGQGGTNPSQVVNNEATGTRVLLKNSTPWIAAKSTYIHFRVLKTLSTEFLIEISRG